MAYQHDVFISYKREQLWTPWTRDHFKKLLQSYLSQDLGRSPDIFVDERVEVGEDWVGALAHLKAANRYDEAEPLMRRALAIDEQSFGSDHPKVATRLNNLAELLRATSRVDEVEPLMRRALAINERSFGPDHPKVATILINLGTLLMDTSRLAEAEPLLRRALSIDEASFGQNHPEVAIDLGHLARLMNDTNRLDEAEPIVRRAFEILIGSSTSTGHIHRLLPDVQRSYVDLLEKLGRGETEIRIALNAVAESPGGEKSDG